MGNNRPYTIEDERAMAAIYQTSPAGLRELTSRFGGSLATAAAALRRQGVTKMKNGGRRRYEPERPPSPPTPHPSSAAAQVSGEQAARIVTQYTGGAHDLRGLARSHGLTTRTVRVVLEIAGLLEPRG